VKNTSDYRLLSGPVHAFVDDSFVSKTSIASDVAPSDVFSCTLGADPATRIRYSRTSKRANDGGTGSAFSEQWAATTCRSRTTVTNRHPFALPALVLRDSVPVCDDDKRVSVVLRRPVGLAELEQGEELKIGEEDSDDEDEGGGEGKDEGKAKGKGEGKAKGKGEGKAKGRGEGKGKGESEGKGEDESESEDESEKRIVRWCKKVDGKGGKKRGLFEWVFEVGAGEEVTIETEWDVKAPVSLKWVESA